MWAMLGLSWRGWYRRPRTGGFPAWVDFSSGSEIELPEDKFAPLASARDIFSSR